MTDGLKDKYRKAIIEILSANERVEKVVLFGSRAMGTFTPTSDVDITLFGDQLTLTDQAKLAEDIDELPIPQQVDILLHKSIKNEKLIEHIKRHGVEWYQRAWAVGSEWQEVPLSQLYEFRSGLSKPRSEFGFGYKFLSFKDVFYNFFIPDKLSELVNSTEREREFCSIKRGDVFLTRTSETMEDLGMSCVALKDYEFATFNGFTKRLRPKANIKIVPEYAGYFFRSPKFRREVTTMSSLSTRASLNNEMLGRLKMVLPSFEEQAAIGFILKSFDDKIELNRRMNETLEAMARAIFKSWFVDFDPVRARRGDPVWSSTKRADTKVCPYMTTEILNLFPDRFQDSDLGEIPKGWKSRSLYDSAKYVNGAAYRNFHFTDEECALPIIKIAELKNGVSDKTKFTKTALDDKYRIDDGEILLSWSGNPDTSIDTFVWSEGAAWLNQHIFRVLPHQKIEKHFVFYLLKYLRPVFAEIARNKQTTGLGHFTARDMKRLMVVHPPEKLLAKFNDLVGPIFDRWYGNLFESHTLASLRDTLLPNLISGELRVPGAEKLLEEVL